jgi:hypothetical protein
MMSADPIASLENEIASLQDLHIEGLRARWRTVTGRRAPVQLSKNLLLRMLAYRMQAQLHGDLDAGTARFLDRLASDRSLLDSRTLPLPDVDMVRPGSLLVREWEGVSHRVMALADGFAWNGGVYASLSQVARAITGTRWNGLVFFGIKRQGSAA